LKRGREKCLQCMDMAGERHSEGVLGRSQPGMGSSDAGSSSRQQQQAAAAGRHEQAVVSSAAAAYPHDHAPAEQLAELWPRDELHARERRCCCPLLWCVVSPATGAAHIEQNGYSRTRAECACKLVRRHC